MISLISSVRPFDGPNSVIISSNTNNSDSLTSQKIDWRDLLETSLSAAAELFCYAYAKCSLQRCRDLRRKTWKNTRPSGKFSFFLAHPNQLGLLRSCEQIPSRATLLWLRNEAPVLILFFVSRFLRSTNRIFAFHQPPKDFLVGNLCLEDPLLWIIVKISPSWTILYLRQKVL